MRERKNVNAISEMLDTYQKYLQGKKQSRTTVERYLWDVKAFVEYLDGGENRAAADGDGHVVDRGWTLDKEIIKEYKNYLRDRYKTISANSMLAAVNSSLAFPGKAEWKMRLFKIQKAQYSRPELEMAEKDYERLILATRKNGDTRMSMLIQTTDNTGAWISGLKFITVEPLKAGQAEIYNEGRSRVVLLPVELMRVLGKHCREAGIASDSISMTKHGNPIDRGNASKKAEQLERVTGMDTVKIFSHNLRHLFARIPYSIEKDVVQLMDLLGYSGIGTTRIYTMAIED